MKIVSAFLGSMLAMVAGLTGVHARPQTRMLRTEDVFTFAQTEPQEATSTAIATSTASTTFSY